MISWIELMVVDWSPCGGRRQLSCSQESYDGSGEVADGDHDQARCSRWRSDQPIRSRGVVEAICVCVGVSWNDVLNLTIKHQRWQRWNVTPVTKGYGVLYRNLRVCPLFLGPRRSPPLHDLRAGTAVVLIIVLLVMSWELNIQIQFSVKQN
jgi:hypothetical protein